MLGDSNAWDPATYLRDRHPDVCVVEVDLPAPLLGCVDHKKRRIYIARGLPEPQRRCTVTYEIAQLEQGPAPADACWARARDLAALDWAARQLIPRNSLLDGFTRPLSIPEIAATLRVDTATLRARLRGLTDDEQDAVVNAMYLPHSLA